MTTIAIAELIVSSAVLVVAIIQLSYMKDMKNIKK